MNKFLKFRFSYFLTLAAGLIICFFQLACSKEKRYERKITDTWVIGSSHATTTNNYTGEESQWSLNYSGQVSFEDNQTGYGDTSSNNPFPTNFTWTNSNRKLFVSDTAKTKEYSLDEFSKTRMYLKYVPLNQISEEDTYREYMVLSRSH